MKPKFLTYCALALFTYTFLNDGVSADCVSVEVWNSGDNWSPYITYTPCMGKEERTDNIGWFSVMQPFSAQPNTKITLGPQSTYTVYFEHILEDESPYPVHCIGSIGTSSATCNTSGRSQKFLKERKKPEKQKIEQQKITKKK